MRPRAQAAALRTSACKSSRRSRNKGTASGHARVHREASARTCGLSCRSSSTTVSNGSLAPIRAATATACCKRSEEHTSELQSRLHLVCRLLLEKKKQRHCHLIISRTGKIKRTCK